MSGVKDAATAGRMAQVEAYARDAGLLVPDALDLLLLLGLSTAQRNRPFPMPELREIASPDPASS